MVLLDPIKAGAEVGPAAAHGGELYRLTSFVHIDLVNTCVEINDVDAFWSLSFENRANLRFEQRELPRVDGAGTIDEDDNFSDALALDTGKVEPLPDVPSIRPHPGVVGWGGLGPGTSKEFPPVDSGSFRALETPFKPGRHLPGEFRDGLCLLNRDLPIPRLLRCILPIGICRLRCIEHLTESSRCLRCVGLVLASSAAVRVVFGRPLLVGLLLPTAVILFLDEVVDALGAHASETVVDQDILWQGQTRIDHQGIDGIVTCHVPSLGAAVS